MSLLFNNSSLWDFYDSLDRDFFGNSFRVSPRALVKNDKDENSIERRPENNLLPEAVPPLDLIEKLDHYKMRVAVPGVSPDEIKLDFDDENNELIVSGEIPEHKVEKDEGGKFYKELSSGSFSRRVRFGKDVKIDSDNIQASLKNGILDVLVPKTKKPEKTAKRIQVANHEKQS